MKRTPLSSTAVEWQKDRAPLTGALSRLPAGLTLAGWVLGRKR